MPSQLNGYNVAEAITKSDTANFVNYERLGRPCEAIHIGTAGNIVVVFQNDATATFKVPAGQILPVQAKRVNSTNTTASEFFALWTV